MKLISVFGGGLWIIPILLLVGIAVSFYKAYRQWISGSEITIDKWFGPLEYIDSDKRVKFLSIPAAKFGIGFLVLLIVCVIVMIGDK